MHISHVLLACAMSLLCAGSSLADQYCPRLMVVGRITSLQRPHEGDKVLVHRGGKDFEASEGESLVYEDIVSLIHGASATIEGPKSIVEIGPGRPSKVWKAPPRPKDEEMLQESDSPSGWKLFNLNYRFSSPIIAQGSDQDCSGESLNDMPIQALSAFNVGRQMIGSDLNKLLIAWKTRTGFADVRITLSCTSSGRLFSKRICRKSHYSIMLPRGALHPGDELLLEVVDVKNNTLTWNLVVVSPERMPAPPPGLVSQSLIGLWRIMNADISYRLDSFSRLSVNDTDLILPRWLLGALLNDEWDGELKK